MATKGCSCGDVKSAQSCGCPGAGTELYWCESCRRVVPDKRCPHCGLKAKKGGPPPERGK